MARIRINLHLCNLYKEIYSPNRFKLISLLLTDYDMPGITGLDLCKTLNSPHITRALLTGVVDESSAINAFNDGFIDKFFRKHDLKVLDDLNDLIKTSQKKYFNSISNNFINLFNKNPNYLSILSDVKFIKLFQSIIEKEGIVEYYLLDYIGSFLMLTADGKASALYITTDEQISLIYNYAQYENCSTNILEDLKYRKKSLWFYDNQQEQDNSNINWEDHLMLLSKIEGENGSFYYSYTHSIPFITKSKIVSFNSYKAQAC